MKDKIYFDLEIPYWKNKRCGAALLRFVHQDKVRVQLSLHTVRRLIEIRGYEDEWGIMKMKHFILWKNY